MHNRYQRFFLLAGLMIGCGVYSDAQTQYWKADFKSGKFPNSATVLPYSGPELVSSVYRHIDLAKSWTVEVAGDRYAALSPSHTRSDEPVSNRFLSPFFTVESPEALIKWEAKSMLPGFCESYSLYYRENEEEEFQTLLTVDEEKTVWTSHALSLGFLEGKNIQLCFECNSADKYLLALSSIWIGVPDRPELNVIDRTKKFVGNDDDKFLRFSIMSSGGAIGDGRLIIRTPSDDMELDSQEWGGADINTGEWREVEIPVDFPANSRSEYSISFLDSFGETLLVKDEVWSAEYERCLLVDEGTGMWCTNCPEGNLELDKLERVYGDQACIISTHVNDILEQTDYWNELGWYNVPRMMLNRNQETAANSSSGFESQFSNPVAGKITVSNVSINENRLVTVDLLSEMADDIENPDDRYGIGYVVTGDFLSSEITRQYYQENGMTAAYSQQYYFLPTRIPSDLAIFRNVNIKSEYGFKVMPGSIPENINRKTPNPFSFSIDMSDIGPEWYNLRLIPFILDTETGAILNSTQYMLSNPVDSGDKGLWIRSSSFIWNGKILTLVGDESGKLEIWNTNGTLLRCIDIHEGESIELPESSGVTIIRFTSHSHSETHKIII